MNKDEWMQSYVLIPERGLSGTTPGEYIMSMPDNGMILNVGLESNGWIAVIVRSQGYMGMRPRKMLVLCNGMASEYKYTRYIGSVNDLRVGGSDAWRHIFEVTRPNDDDDKPMKEDGKILLATTPGC